MFNGRPFPVDAFPKIIRNAIYEVEQHTQAPQGLIAASALGVISLACQNRIDVCRLNNLRGPVSLFLMTLAEAGERKFTVDNLLMKPLYQLEEDLFENEIPMYIMSNPIKMNGAATMAYPGVIRNFAETIRKNLYVIPSSIHEVILVPESGTEDTNLNDMVAEVNHTQVDPKEVLADHVYYYDRKEDHMISCVHENICYC